MMNGFSMAAGMWIFWVVFVVIVVFVIKMMVSDSSRRSSIEMETPLDILKRRFARGEISEDEFDRMKKELENKT